MNKLYLLSAILSITATFVNASCPSVRGLSSPTNIVNTYIDDLFHDFDVKEQKKSIQLVQILENPSQTKFKILLQVLDTYTSKVKYYIGVKSHIVMKQGKPKHKITSYLHSVSKDEIKKVFGSDFSFTHDNSCFEPKREFFQFFSRKGHTSNWFNKNLTQKREDSKETIERMMMLTSENETLKTEISIVKNNAEQHLSVVMNKMLATKEKNLNEIARLRTEIDMLKGSQKDNNRIDQLIIELEQALIAKDKLESELSKLKIANQQELLVLKNKLNEKEVSESLLTTELERKNNDLQQMKQIKQELLAANALIDDCKNELEMIQKSKINDTMELEVYEIALNDVKTNMNDQINELNNEMEVCLKDKQNKEEQINQLVIIIEENEKQIKQIQGKKTKQKTEQEIITNNINEKLDFQKELEIAAKETTLDIESVKEQFEHNNDEIHDVNSMINLLKMINLNLLNRSDISSMQLQTELNSSFFKQISDNQRRLLQNYLIQIGSSIQLNQMGFNELEDILYELRDYLFRVSPEEKKKHALLINKINSKQQKTVQAPVPQDFDLNNPFLNFKSDFRRPKAKTNPFNTESVVRVQGNPFTFNNKSA